MCHITLETAQIKALQAILTKHSKVQLSAVLAENLLPFVTLPATFRRDNWAYTSSLRRLNQTAPGHYTSDSGASLISKRQNDALREWLETNSNQSPHWSKDDAYADLPKVRFPKGKVLVHV
jgi:hypothetical protein